MYNRRERNKPGKFNRRPKGGLLALMGAGADPAPSGSTGYADIDAMIARSEARSRQIDELLASVRANAPERLRNTPGFRLLAGGGAPAQSGILPDASMEPMGYEPPPVTADYFATPTPTEYQDFAAPPPTEYRGFTPIAELRAGYDDFIRDQGLVNPDYPELPTDADLNANYEQSLRDRGIPVPLPQTEGSMMTSDYAGLLDRLGALVPQDDPFEARLGNYMTQDGMQAYVDYLRSIMRSGRAGVQ